MGDWKNVVNWYGGRIQCRAKLQVDKTTKAPTIKLLPFILGKSNRATREMGSLSILQVKYDASIFYDRAAEDVVKSILRGPLVICGRTYLIWAVKAKDLKVFFVETDQDYERSPNRRLGDHLRRSFADFIQWMNPVELNAGQVSAFLFIGRCTLS